MFEFNIKKQSPYIWVDLIGKLISDEDATNMMDTISSELSSKNPFIIMNLKDLNYINSSGFNNFLKVLTLSRNIDGDTILCNTNNNIKLSKTMRSRIWIIIYYIIHFPMMTP